MDSIVCIELIAQRPFQQGAPLDVTVASAAWLNSTIIVEDQTLLSLIEPFRRRDVELVDFKEASFIQGKLIRIAKKKMEILVDDEETGEPVIATVRLADDVTVDLDAVGEEVKAVIADGKVARITVLAPTQRPALEE